MSITDAVERLYRNIPTVESNFFAIVIALFRNKPTVNLDEYNLMKW